MTTTEHKLDTTDLTRRVKVMYKEAALHPEHTDALLAALVAGEEGQVVGVDMTEEQLTKARTLAAQAGIPNADFRRGVIEAPPVQVGSVDCVISNGVVNLSPDKGAVFAAAAAVVTSISLLATRAGEGPR